MLNSLKCNRFLIFILFIVLLLTISGCSNPFDMGEEKISETNNPDAEEILALDPDADIFKYNGIIYQTNIDWVEEKSLTKDEQVGEIKVKNEENTNFEDEMSNKLPVGTKIFKTKEDEDFLIVELNGKTLIYYAIVEG